MDRKNYTNLIAQLEIVSSAAANSKLETGNLTKIRKELKNVSEFLKLSSIQTILFASVTELSFQRTVTLDALSNHLDFSVLRLITYMNELEYLERKGLIQKLLRKRNRKHSYNDMGYTVPHNIIEALRLADRKLLKSSPKFDLPGFLKQMGDLVDERNNGSSTTEQLFTETKYLIDKNLDIPYVSMIDTKLSKTVSKLTVFALSYSRLKNMISLYIENFAASVYDDLSENLMFSQHLASDSHELTKSGLIKLVASDFNGDKMIGLTRETEKALYKNYPDLILNEKEVSDLMRHDSIKQKDLYFNTDTADQIKPLEQVLRNNKIKTYRKKLLENGLSSGITAIFHGKPGTGKTESVYQLAKKTGRDIKMIDLSQTKSKWFGESEKLVKKIFEDYKAILNSGKREPILFINEADGLLSTRLNLNVRGTSADQAINTMQNILLQELESFEGILIATTNLTDNLDRAFERRFTFKIVFPEPDSIVRSKIWRHKLPELSPKEASVLGDQFEISGGEIDIHVRHLLLKKVINKNIDLFNTVYNSCCKEHGFASKKRVGF